MSQFPVMVLCHEQTAGRGRQNRNWFSAKGKGLYVSFGFTIRTVHPLQYLPFLPALAVLNTLQDKSALKFTLKWPNDILYQQKKVAGILVETVVYKEYTVVIMGIGINVCHQLTDFPPQLQDSAISLSLISNHFNQCSMQTLAACLGQSLQFWTDEYLEKKYDHIIDQVNQFSTDMLNRPLLFHYQKTTISGYFQGIHSDGSAIIKHADGSIRHYFSGEMEFPNHQ
jgi:BirA family biotin operon repressor/biotin-[acetyl-CoA-carboxylase] ligase